MKKGKQTRRERAATARAIQAVRKTQPNPKRDFLSDRQARFRAYLWTAAAIFGYGVFNDLFLDRIGRRINKEAVVIGVFVFALCVTTFYMSQGREYLSLRLWGAVERWSAKRRLAFVGGTLAVLVLALGAIPTSVVEASLIKVVQSQRVPEAVKQAAGQRLAYLQASRTIDRVEAAHSVVTPTDAQNAGPLTPLRGPAILGKGIDQTTVLLTPSAEGFAYTHPFPMLFSDFTVIAIGQPVGWSKMQRFLITSQGSTTTTVVNNVKVVGLEQDLANLTWTNVEFADSVIEYTGGPLRMGNVIFKGCSFREPDDPKGKALFAYLQIHQGEPISAYIQ